jgi:hypothetical protein
MGDWYQLVEPVDLNRFERSEPAEGRSTRSTSELPDPVSVYLQMSSTKPFIRL